MRITITKSSVTKVNPDGSLTVTRIPQQEAQANFDDAQVRFALDHFRLHRDISPLVQLLKESNEGVLRNLEARELIASAALGELCIGRGRVRSQDAIERDRRILAATEWLKKIGIPLKNARDKNRSGELQASSACRLIAGRINLTEDAVYSIVRKPRKDLAASPVLSALKESPYTFLGPKWIFSDAQPTATEILDHYFSTPDLEEYLEPWAMWCELRPSLVAAAKRALDNRQRRTSRIETESGRG